MPAYLPVTAGTVNYAPVVFVGFTSISLAWYITWGHKNYAGPPTEQIGEDVAPTTSSSTIPGDVKKPVPVEGSLGKKD